MSKPVKKLISWFFSVDARLYGAPLYDEHVDFVGTLKPIAAWSEGVDRFVETRTCIYELMGFGKTRRDEETFRRLTDELGHGCRMDLKTGTDARMEAKS